MKAAGSKVPQLEIIQGPKDKLEQGDLEEIRPKINNIIMASDQGRRDPKNVQVEDHKYSIDESSHFSDNEIGILEDQMPILA